MSIVGVANMKVTHDVNENLRKIEELVASAHDEGAQLLVLPEVALQGYADFAFPTGSKEAGEQLRYYLRTAETIPGPATERLADLARRTRMTLQFGLAERDHATTKVFNAVAVVDAHGLRGSYRKVHNQFEHPYFAPGGGLRPIPTEHGMIGPAICYDVAFPELARGYALRGVRLITMSTAWPMKGHDRHTDYHGRMMDLCCRANAFFNQVALVCSNHCETGAYSQGVDYYGNSQIVAPTGDVIGVVGPEEGVLVREIDLDGSVETARTEEFFGLSLLADRRPECYQGADPGPGGKRELPSPELRAEEAQAVAPTG